MTEDLIGLATRIMETIAMIKRIRREIRKRSLARAEAIAAHDRELGKVMIMLKNGRKIDCDGEWIQNPPATMTEKIAKGVVWPQKLEMEKADALYRSALSNLESLRAELMGYQSIYKHLEEA